MRLSDLSIRNPVFAVMLSLALVVFGWLGYRDLGISQFPEIDFPVVSINTAREGASPETMDYDVTDIIEDAVSGVEGIDYIQSASTYNSSSVTVYFRLSRNVDSAMQDVQNAVAGAAARLPTDIDPPVISKINFNKFPILWLSVHGDVPLKTLNAFVDDTLKKHVQTLPGVGGVIFGGLRSRNMRIWLDREKLQSHNLDASDVWAALRSQQVELPAGSIVGESREINVRFRGESITAEQFAKVPILTKNQQIVTLGEVAVIEDGLADRRSFSRFNGRRNVGVGVMRATGANVVQVCDDVKSRLPELRKLCPPGVEISISTDYSLFIKDDIEDVQEALMLGVVLTAIVTFLFLGSLGTTLNVCISIPASLMGTFIAIRTCGFTINFMTLLALSLSVGVVVDDAILVLENIYRRMELGQPRRQAAIEGAREITFAALAATLSIVAIFIPIAFLEGAIGRFFYQFGITVSVAVLLSLVIALTITPMLCSRFLTVRHPRRPMPARWGGLLGLPVTVAVRAMWVVDRWIVEPILLNPINWTLDKLTKVYRVLLAWSLRHTLLVMVSSLLFASTSVVFVSGIDAHVPERLQGLFGGRERLTVKPIGRELVPSEDQNRLAVTVICPVGSNVDYVSEMLARGERVMRSLKDPVTDEDMVAGFFATTSIRPGGLLTEANMFLRLVPAEERSRTQTDIANDIRKGFSGIPGVRVLVLDMSTQGFTPSRGFPVDFAIQGPDWDKVIALSEKIRERLQRGDEPRRDENGEIVLDDDDEPVMLKGGYGVLTDIQTDYRPGMPEVQIEPDRQKALERDMPMQRIAQNVGIGNGGLRDGRFTAGSKRYDVRMRYLETQRETPDMVVEDFVRNAQGQLIPLRDVVKANTVSTLPVVNRYNHLRKVELTANMAPGVAQGEAIARALAIAEECRQEMNLPESYRFVQLGNSSAMNETISSLGACLALGFLIAAMILGVQFNSFVHPLTVLIAVPFGVTGALATLFFFGHTLNMMSMIGMILVAGLVKKNSIILVDYTNQLRKQGKGIDESILEACPIRLRPILMTSLATIAGAIPLALATGAGTETRAPLARSIVGGCVFATLITLFIVPVFYRMMERLQDYGRRITRREAGSDAR